jgi:hypothetical protein
MVGPEVQMLVPPDLLTVAEAAAAGLVEARPERAEAVAQELSLFTIDRTFKI